LEAINNALDEEMSRDPKVMVLGLDVGKLGGVCRATSGLLEKHGAQLVGETPLAEASIVGASLGLAISGMVPIAEIQFLGFTAQAFHMAGLRREAEKLNLCDWHHPGDRQAQRGADDARLSEWRLADKLCSMFLQQPGRGAAD